MDIVVGENEIEYVKIILQVQGVTQVVTAEYVRCDDLQLTVERALENLTRKVNRTYEIDDQKTFDEEDEELFTIVDIGAE